jgi:hypothetical protein
VREGYILQSDTIVVVNNLGAAADCAVAGEDLGLFGTVRPSGIPPTANQSERSGDNVDAAEQIRRGKKSRQWSVGTRPRGKG